MSTSDILQWVITTLMGLGLLYLAVRKAPIERESFSASTTAQYANAAKTKGEENEKLLQKVTDLENRLAIVERKKYRIVSEFTIGDPPEVGKVLIEPIVEPLPLVKPKPKGRLT
jgi:hypothetical protein